MPDAGKEREEKERDEGRMERGGTIGEMKQHLRDENEACYGVHHFEFALLI